MISGQTKLAGLFADPASHSLSPLMHNTAFEANNIEEMKTKRDALNEIVQNLTVKLYEQAAQQQAQENPEAAQGGADDVVDADFEEVDGDDK